MCYSLICKNKKCRAFFIGSSWGALESSDPEIAEMLKERKCPYCEGALEIWDSFLQEILF